ncbi:hypothetical protein MAV100_13290 [Mycobacterium avium subsp. hominissuis 100]|nr:hypothetical protein MAV100_13290 [Mycobacterium avium subsp. hominissuis 100]
MFVSCRWETVETQLSHRRIASIARHDFGDHVG